MLPPVLLAAFPDLAADGGIVTHPPDRAYNCVAWAVGVTHTAWWPSNADAFWPPTVSDELTIDAMIAALETVGYFPCPDGQSESGFEKVAVYAKGGVPTHMARQLHSGSWSSKLGRDCTVSHQSPEGVAGAVYGSVVAYLCRSIP